MRRRAPLLVPLLAVLALGCVGTPFGPRGGRPSGLPEPSGGLTTAASSTPTTSPSPGATVASPLESPRSDESASPLNAPSPGGSGAPAGLPSPSPSPVASPTPRPHASIAPFMAQEVRMIDQDSPADRPVPHRYLALSVPSDAALTVRLTAGGDAGALRALMATRADGLAPCGRSHSAPRPASQARRRVLGTPPDTETFWVSPGTASVPDTEVHTHLVASGDHLAVYGDDTLSPDDQATLATRAQVMVSTFDGSIYETDRRIFGDEPNPGIDGDPRLYVLVSPAVDNGGQAPLPAFFSPQDLAASGGNRREMIYLASSHVLTREPSDWLGSLAHEFQHVINFNQKSLIGHQGIEELWIDEGLAMYAMQANGYGANSNAQVFGHQVRLFAGAPGAYSLTQWGLNPGSDGFGAAYLFFEYLAERFGQGLIGELTRTPVRGVDNLDAVLRAHGSSWNEAFYDWSIANLLDGRADDGDPSHRYPDLELRFVLAWPDLPRFNAQAVPTGETGLRLQPRSFRFLQLPSEGTFSFSGASMPAVQPAWSL